MKSQALSMEHKIYITEPRSAVVMQKEENIITW